MRNAHRKRNVFVIAFNAVVLLSLILFAAPLLFAGTGVLYKKARLQQDLAKEGEYFYRPIGKVDPFAPFIIKEEESREDLGVDDFTRKKTKRMAAMERVLKKLTTFR